MRYLPLTSEDRRAMLAKIGVSEIDALFRDVPKGAIAPLSAFNLPWTQGEMEVDDILELALQGRMFVFANEDFAVTAEFVYYPRKTVMVVGYGAGKVPAYRNVAKVLIDAAEHVGASAIRTYCRNPAMQRCYRRWFDGVEPTYTVLEKQL